MRSGALLRRDSKRHLLRVTLSWQRGCTGRSTDPLEALTPTRRARPRAQRRPGAGRARGVPGSGGGSGSGRSVRKRRWRPRFRFRGRRGRGAAPPAAGPASRASSSRSLPSPLRHGGQHRQPAGRVTPALPGRGGSGKRRRAGGGARKERGRGCPGPGLRAEPGHWERECLLLGGPGAPPEGPRTPQRRGRGGDSARLGLGVAETPGSALIAPGRESLGRRPGKGLPAGTSPEGRGQRGLMPAREALLLLVWTHGVACVAVRLLVAVGSLACSAVPLVLTLDSGGVIRSAENRPRSEISAFQTVFFSLRLFEP